MSLDTIATGDGSRICRIVQSGGWIAAPGGSLPTTPSWDTMRLEEFDLDVDTEVKESEEINADREFRGVYATAITVGGRVRAPLIYGEHDSLLLDALHSSGFSSGLAKIGSARRYWLWEETTELGFSDQYKRFVNCQCDSTTLTFPAEGRVTIEQQLIGSHMLTDSAIITGATYPAQSYDRTPATVEGIANVTWTGLPVGVDPIIEEVKITIEHGLNRRKVWNSLYTIPPRRGRARVTAEIKAYFDNRKLYDAVLSRTAVGFKFDTGAAGAGYRFEIGRLEWIKPRTDARRTNSDTMLTLTGNGSKSSSKSSLEITKL